MVEASTASVSSTSDAAHDENSPVTIVEVSRKIVQRPNETLWMILNKEVLDANVFIDTGSRMLPAEHLKIYKKLVIFSLPPLIYPGNNGNSGESTGTFKVFLRCGSAQIEVPVKLSLSKSTNQNTSSKELGKKAVTADDMKTFVQALFEFATDGDPLALLRPLRPLLASTDDDGCNSLHLAARSKQNFALKTLLLALRDSDSESSAEFNSNTSVGHIMNARNARGQTPLLCAVRAGDADCVHYLLSAGASRTIPDNQNNTVAHYLGEAYNDAIYKEILEMGDSDDNLVEKDKKSLLEKKNDEGYTPAHIAVRKLKLGLLEALIEAGAPIDIPDQHGETPLMTAVNIDDNDAVTLLTQHSCNVNITSKVGDTPLKVACRRKNLVMIGRLLDAGASLETLGTGSERPPEADDEDVKEILNGKRVEQSNSDESEDDLSRANYKEKAHDGSEFNNNRDNGPETPGASTESYRLGIIAKDDVSCLDYLTRLRLSKILDVEDKWAILADYLGCGHMVEYIRVCMDDSSSPTMLLLDQYEQIPLANLSSITKSLEDMGETLGVRLIRTGNEQQS